MKIRRALLTVSDKKGLVELGRALAAAGAEIVATGNTAKVLVESGLMVTPIEEISKSPEAFQGRMKTLSFPVCSGILSRRGDSSDDADLERLKILPIDCVVVNFYPFEKALETLQKENEDSDLTLENTRSRLIEEIDIGGPTLVRAAAKNSSDVLVLTDPELYPMAISELAKKGQVSPALMEMAAERAWDLVLRYDRSIATVFGGRRVLKLRYGENPHQDAQLEYDPQGPVDWQGLTPNPLSYNNILDFSSAHALASDLSLAFPNYTGVVIIKHNNPCGVCWVPKAGRSLDDAQLFALKKAWDGDPVSAFGGVLLFTDKICPSTSSFLEERFVELVGAPDLNADALTSLLAKRKKLKAVTIKRFLESGGRVSIDVAGGRLVQTADFVAKEEVRSMTENEFPTEKFSLVRFGIAVVKALKSNALAIVQEVPGEGGVFQLVGAGQGQPNRIESLRQLAIPRALSVLHETGGSLSDTVLVSDAFFPFRDTVDTAFAAGIKFIVQPGGSLKDGESINACNEHKIAMAFTGVRHFKH